jgi:hypothetical protein
VSAGERDDHDALAVGRGEIARGAPVQVIADPGTVSSDQPRFCQATRVAGYGERHVGRRERYPAALPGVPPSNFGGQGADGCVETTGYVPGRDHVIHRSRPSLRPGDHRRPVAALTVVDGAAVVVALDLQLDQILPDVSEGRS